MRLSQRPPCRRRVIAATVLALCAPAAFADADDTFSLTPSVAWMHDDNIFRLSSGELADDITIASLTLKIDKKYSMQRFELETSYVDYRYSNYDYLNYSALPYRAAWLWSVTPDLHGDLSADQTESLSSFDNTYNTSKRNINTVKNSRLAAVYDVNPSWHLLGGVSHYDYSNSEFTQGEGDNTIDRVEGGVRFTPTDRTTLTYLMRDGRGDYYNRPQPIEPLYFDNAFDDRENELALHWEASGKTTIDARLGYVDRQHEHFASRDYSGTVGNIAVNWNYTGNALLTAIASREIASYQTINSNYTVTDRIALAPTWQLAGKTILRLRYDYAWRDYEGSPGALPPSGRRDKLRVGLIALEWNPVRTAVIRASLQSERRDSNQSDLDYKDMMFNLSAQVTF